MMTDHDTLQYPGYDNLRTRGQRLARFLSNSWVWDTKIQPHHRAAWEAFLPVPVAVQADVAGAEVFPSYTEFKVDGFSFTLGTAPVNLGGPEKRVIDEQGNHYRLMGLNVGVTYYSLGALDPSELIEFAQLLHQVAILAREIEVHFGGSAPGGADPFYDCVRTAAEDYEMKVTNLMAELVPRHSKGMRVNSYVFLHPPEGIKLGSYDYEFNKRTYRLVIDSKEAALWRVA